MKFAALEFLERKLDNFGRFNIIGLTIGHKFGYLAFLPLMTYSKKSL